MQILAVDIGTGTQDILLFDSERAVENCLKLVMPSPTLLIGEQIKRATAARLPLLIQGVVMGGGPAAWAVEAHRRVGLRVLATPDAAATFNDDLDYVQREMGVELIHDEDARRLAGNEDFVHIEFRDFDYDAIRRAFAAFGFDLHPDALALAVFDHGAAPPDVSDRQFRMDYLVERLHRDRRLSTFAFHAADVPSIMTRLAALAATAIAQADAPVIVMDTAPAAVLGALDDPVVAAHRSALVANVGNFHTLAFQFRDGAFVRLFEHHTGLLTPETLTGWLRIARRRRDQPRGGVRRSRPRRAGIGRRSRAAGVLGRRRTPAGDAAGCRVARLLRRAARRSDAHRLLRPAARLRRSGAGLARADHRGAGRTCRSQFVVDQTTDDRRRRQDYLHESRITRHVSFTNTHRGYHGRPRHHQRRTPHVQLWPIRGHRPEL